MQTHHFERPGKIKYLLCQPSDACIYEMISPLSEILYIYFKEILVHY